jgi:Zn-dependent protease with chaperone function
VLAAALAVGLALLVVFTATTFTRSTRRETLARRYFSEQEIARGERFSLERRLLFWPALLVELVVLSALAFSGAGIRLAALGERLGGGRWPFTLLVVAAAVFAAQQLAAFPFDLFGGLYLQRAWGLTARSLASWLGDYAKGLLLQALFGMLLTLGLYALMRFMPRAWWLAASAGSAAFGVALAYLLPLLIAPLFNTFTPLAQTKHAALLPAVEALAAQAGLPVKEVLVMDASRQGRYTNAYFAGFGPSRRIVLYDTLLASHTREETLSILAHEIGHWRAHHIAKGLALGTAGALVGFFVLARLLSAATAAGWLRAPFDPAGLPLVLLLASLAGFFSLPVQNAFSRRFERQADRAALELYGHPEVFIEAEKRLARDNVANVAPSDAAVWMFATHPPTLDRIAMAESWEAGHPGS